MNWNLLLVVAAYALGYVIGYDGGYDAHKAKVTEEQNTQLIQTLERYESAKKEYETMLSSIRSDESKSRTELDRMRKQLAAAEKRAKTECDRKLNRCLQLAIDGKELLDRISGPVAVCEQSHK